MRERKSERERERERERETSLHKGPTQKGLHKKGAPIV